MRVPEVVDCLMNFLLSKVIDVARCDPWLFNPFKVPRVAKDAASRIGVGLVNLPSKLSHRRVSKLEAGARVHILDH